MNSCDAWEVRRDSGKAANSVQRQRLQATFTTKETTTRDRITLWETQMPATRMVATDARDT